MPESAALSQPVRVHAAASAVRPAPRWDHRVELLTFGLILVFAIESASFIARNSDVWRHLATGRLLAEGGYRFGSDPLAFTTAGRYWANHAWLFDLGAYGVWLAAGGTALVALKALVVAATAAAMLTVARGRGPGWVAFGSVLLGVIAFGPRVQLEPVAGSYLFLACCLLCLARGGMWLRIVPIAIILWVNVDGWFFLGPVLVGLFWLGRRIASRNLVSEDKSTVGDPRSPGAWPGWLFPASVAACFLSPHHIRVWVLPEEVSPSVWSSSFHSDPRFTTLFASPWDWRTLNSASGYNLSAWAFFVLLGTGVFSFAINRGALRTWRGPVWLVFALLGVWQARLIPFFAVVGAPICSLNLGEVMPSVRFARLGRGMVLMASSVLVVLGYFGWESGIHTQDRGLAWDIHADATLVRAAEGIAQWEKDANLPGAHIFTTHPALGDYVAWIAPGQKSFIDSRLALFVPIADEYEMLSRAAGLLPGADRERLADAVRARGIAAVALFDPDFARTSSALMGLSQREAANWDIDRIDGSAVLLVPRGTTPADLRFDPERLAFDPRTVSRLPRAGNGPADLVEPDPWQVLERRTGRRGSWEADAALLFTDHSRAGGPLLAIRAARAGIEKDPRDSNAWLVLARAYLQHGVSPGKPSVFAALTPLTALRQIQTTAALVQAALLDPDSASAHELLADVFLRGESYDLALRHLSEYVRLIRRDGDSAGGESGEERRSALLDLQDRVEAAVQAAENRYLIRTSTLAGDPLARARIADELGLRQKAVDVLLASHPDLYGVEGLKLLAELLLRTGKVREADSFLDRNELRSRPGVLGSFSVPGYPHPDGHRWSYQFPAYDWFVLAAAASSGRYDDAQAAVERLTDYFEQDERTVGRPLTASLAGEIATEVGLAAPPGVVLGRLEAANSRYQLGEHLGHVRFLTVARADLATVACMLDLERGHVETALAHGEFALELYAARRGSAPALPGEPVARRYVEALRRYR